MCKILAIDTFFSICLFYAASALDKAAKIIENIHPEQALNLYQHAIEVVMVILMLVTFHLMQKRN